MVTRSVYETVYNVNEVARIFRLTPRTVRSLIRSGELPAIRLGREYRIPKPIIDAFFDNPLKSNFSPEDLGFGMRKPGKVDSVTQVNRIRDRNKKTLKQTVAELEKWRA
ncbi:MAG: helix-turn-helix domain-containing protein [Chloroflexi bacterium]|nr:helix-turn-helix domain-containing protein [Chloroflexota bacterium]